MTDDIRRTYYDHEPAYRRIAGQGGRGWDDLNGPTSATDSYDALEAFLESDWFRSLPQPVRAMDLGCGGGQGTIRLAQQGCEVHGIDFSETAIALARTNVKAAGVSAVLTVGNAFDLDGVDAEQFDLVIDNHLLHCLIEEADRRALLATAWRVLRPGGLMFSETMSAEGDLDFAALDIDPVTRRTRNRTRFWTTLAELRHLFDSNGFTILAQKRRPQADQLASGDTIVTIARRAIDGG